MAIKDFLEDYDGVMVLGDVRNFHDAKDFLIKAEAYVEETRGHRMPVSEPTITEIKLNEEKWEPADVAEFEGKVVTVYMSDIFAQS